MKVITPDTGFLVYQKIFKYLQSSQADLTIWQVTTEGKRQVSKSKLHSYNLESGNLHLQLNNHTDVSKSLPLYCYAEDGQVIFKSSISEVRDLNFSIGIPLEIKLLEDPDIHVFKGSMGLSTSTVWKSKFFAKEAGDSPNDILRVKSMAERSQRDQKFLSNEFNPVSIDEEDKLFADKRESPRARPKKDKWVKVRKKDGEDIEFFRLFDLSQGGMSFVTTNPDLFPKTTEVFILGFDEFDLDDPLIGTVMSQRDIDKTNEFKIGIKFNEGQE